LPKATQRLSDHEKQDSQDLTIWSECQASRLEKTWHPPYGEAFDGSIML
jgi:hypothetical protein